MRNEEWENSQNITSENEKFQNTTSENQSAKIHISFFMAKYTSY